MLPFRSCPPARFPDAGRHDLVQWEHADVIIKDFSIHARVACAHSSSTTQFLLHKQPPTMPTSGTSFSNHGMRRRESSGHYRFTMSLWQACRLLLGFLVLVKSQAQDEPQIGVDICFCAPASYEFTLDFSLFCPPVNITQGDAVASTTCFVQPKFIEAVSDLIPVAVSRIIILELNQQQSTVSREEIVSSLGDGGTFQYTSLVALPGEVVDVTRLPRAIQLNIDGVNSLDEAITNIVTVTFTNNCGRYPVFFEGQSAGWVRFVSRHHSSADIFLDSIPSSYSFHFVERPSTTSARILPS